MQQLFVGLGNPGAEYAMHRHNVGFRAVDRMHARWRGAPWRAKFGGEAAEATVGDVRVLMLKPATYMNESGRSVAEAARFYKLDLDAIVIVHDEIDLPPGRFRMKTGGGSGGHNGLRSTSQSIKDGYRRLRIGVGHPGRKEAVPGYVLHDFSKADEAWLGPLLDALAEEAPLLATGKDSAFASKVHLRLGGSAVAASDGAARRAARRAAAGSHEPPPRTGEDKAAPPAESGSERAGPFAALAGLARRD